MKDVNLKWVFSVLLILVLPVVSIAAPLKPTNKAAVKIEGQLPLKDVFKDAFLIGGAFNHYLVSGRDPNVAAIAARHLNTATSENDMKWQKIHPRPGKYNPICISMQT
jgi:endo-1,4-beta-xylanase